jgi:predicted DCC family thiol-disulfide oxidoreductase YuxK
MPGMPRLARPLLVFDGDCSFCMAWIERWRRLTGDAVDYAPSQRVASDVPDIAPERFKSAVVLIEPDGRVTDGAEAVFRSRAAAGHGLGLWLYDHVPPFAAAARLVYRLVAGHRGPLTVLTRLLWGEHVAPPGERLTAWMFVRALAIVYFAAFASLGVQIVGLVGRDGVLPIGAFLEAVAQQVGPSRFWLLPTLCWWNAGDGFLVAQ